MCEPTSTQSVTGYLHLNNNDTRKIVMSHYTVGWDDSKHIHHEICEYADDSWNAAKQAREDVPYLREHPFSMNEILNEDHLLE